MQVVPGKGNTPHIKASNLWGCRVPSHLTFSYGMVLLEFEEQLALEGCQERCKYYYQSLPKKEDQSLLSLNTAIIPDMVH